MKHIRKNALRHLAAYLCIIILLPMFVFDISAKAQVIPVNTCELPASDIDGDIIYSQSEFEEDEFSVPKSGKIDEFFFPTDEMWSISKTDSSHESSMQIGRNGYWTLSDAKQENAKDVLGSVYEVSFDFKNTNQGHIYFYFCTVNNNRLNKGGL